MRYFPAYRPFFSFFQGSILRKYSIFQSWGEKKCFWVRKNGDFGTSSEFFYSNQSENNFLKVDTQLFSIFNRGFGLFNRFLLLLLFFFCSDNFFFFSIFFFFGRRSFDAPRAWRIERCQCARGPGIFLPHRAGGHGDCISRRCVHGRIVDAAATDPRREQFPSRCRRGACGKARRLAATPANCRVSQPWQWQRTWYAQ
jgi:hypothetical protein